MAAKVISTATGMVTRTEDGKIGLIRHRDAYLFMHFWLTPEEQDALWEVLKDDDRRAVSRRPEDGGSEGLHTDPGVGGDGLVSDIVMVEADDGIIYLKIEEEG